jgi:hypothetical protein
LIDRLLIHFHSEAKRYWLFHIQWRTRMTMPKILSAALVAAAMLATPAMAREHHVTTSQHFAEDANASASPVGHYADGRVCVQPPRVGAFATAPWTGNNVPCEPEGFN